MKEAGERTRDTNDFLREIPLSPDVVDVRGRIAERERRTGAEVGVESAEERVALLPVDVLGFASVRKLGEDKGKGGTYG